MKGFILATLAGLAALGQVASMTSPLSQDCVTEDFLSEAPTDKVSPQKVQKLGH